MPRGVFGSMPDLKVLNCAFNSLEGFVPEGAFRRLRDGDDCRGYDKEVGMSSSSLEVLNLGHNRFGHALPDNAFTGMTNLVEVRLDRNDFVSTRPSLLLCGGDGGDDNVCPKYQHLES